MTIGDDGVATRDNTGASWKGNQGYKPCSLYTERKFHDWRWLGWPLGSIIPVKIGEKWCEVCGLTKRVVSGKWAEAGYRQPETSAFTRFDVKWRRPNEAEVLECHALTANSLAFRIRAAIRSYGSIELLALTPVSSSERRCGECHHEQKFFYLRPEADSERRDLLKDAGAIVCVNDPDVGARVEIRFSELEDAQRLHKALVQTRAPLPVAEGEPQDERYKTDDSDRPSDCICLSTFKDYRDHTSDCPVYKRGLAAPTAAPVVESERCKCGLEKDDPIHSFSTEFQQMHKFTPGTVTLSDAPQVAEQAIYVSKHPLHLRCNVCGLKQIKSLQCPREDGQLVVDDELSTPSDAAKEIVREWVAGLDYGSLPPGQISRLTELIAKRLPPSEAASDAARPDRNTIEALKRQGKDRSS